MSLLNTPFWDVFQASFAPEAWKSILPAIWETLYMTGITMAITLVLGMALGLLLTVANPDGLHPIPWLFQGLGAIVNCLRSLPQMIMIILMIPVSRMVLGKAYGVNACIIALAASCIPMFGWIAESSFMELEKGKIEAAKAMGSSNFRIIARILVPEALPSLIRGFTVTTIAIISMTALAGNFGAGGIGDIAVRFGFQRFQHEVLFASVYCLIILVQAVQLAGDFSSKLLLRIRHLV
jgi:D-methionine transport system permease protein